MAISETIIILVTTMCILGTGCQALSLWIVCKCKKIPFKAKVANLSYLVSDLTITLSITLSLLTLGIFEEDLHVHRIRICIVRIFFTVSWATSTHIAVDRMILVLMPHRYKALLNVKAVKIWTTLDWTIPPIAAGICLIYSELIVSGSCFHGTNFYDCTQGIRSVLLALCCFYGLVFLLSSLLVLVSLRTRTAQFESRPRVQSQRNTIYDDFRKRLSKVTLSYFTLQSFFVVNEIIVDYFPQYTETTWRRILHLIVFFGYVVVFVVKFVYCLWRFEEFRDNFIKFISCKRNQRQNALEMRTNISFIQNSY